MRIVSWNIQHLEQYDRSIDSDLALSQMLSEQNADVLLLQEVDVNKPRTNMVDQLSQIASAFGAINWKFKETRLVPVEQGQYGIGIASKLPVSSWHQLDLVRSPIGRRLTFEFGDNSETFYVADHPRAALAVILESGYCIINTHLSFMPLAAHFQMVRVILWGKRLANTHNCKLIFGGDFNFESAKWLKFFGLRDAIHGKTFPSWRPEKQIDHFLVDNSQEVLTSQIGDSGPISDHRWIALEI